VKVVHMEKEITLARRRANKAEAAVNVDPLDTSSHRSSLLLVA
jgi:hypothetical protein